MLLLHETHSVAGTHEDAFDTCLRDATTALEHANIENAEFLARHILCEVTGLTPAQLLLQAEAAIGPDALHWFKAFLKRTCAHEPLSRITGTKEFHGRTFKLNEATLDPRPDSETLIEAVIEIAKEQDAKGWEKKAFRFIDIGTGTGCLAITLLAIFPNARALATDIEDKALEAARQNASDQGVLDRLQLSNKKSLEEIEGPFDLLISNPPYIPTPEISALAPEVREHDPIKALDGGPDGLDVYRQIAKRLKTVIPQGWAVFEVGASQAHDVLDIFQKIQIGGHRLWKDLSSHTRCVAVRTHCASRHQKCFEISLKPDTL